MEEEPTVSPEDLPATSTSLDELLGLGAKEIKYGDWDGIPVLTLTLNSEHGLFDQPYGLKNGVWTRGWPSPQAILNDTLNVSREEFDRLVASPRTMGAD